MLKSLVSYPNAVGLGQAVGGVESSWLSLQSKQTPLPRRQIQ